MEKKMSRKLGMLSFLRKAAMARYLRSCNIRKSMKMATLEQSKISSAIRDLLKKLKKQAAPSVKQSKKSVTSRSYSTLAVNELGEIYKRLLLAKWARNDALRLLYLYDHRRSVLIRKTLVHPLHFEFKMKLRHKKIDKNQYPRIFCVLNGKRWGRFRINKYRGQLVGDFEEKLANKIRKAELDIDRDCWKGISLGEVVNRESILHVETQNGYVGLRLIKEIYKIDASICIIPTLDKRSVFVEDAEEMGFHLVDRTDPAEENTD